jgi:hypothetical protein
MLRIIEQINAVAAQMQTEHIMREDIAGTYAASADDDEARHWLGGGKEADRFVAVCVITHHTTCIRTCTRTRTQTRARTHTHSEPFVFSPELGNVAFASATSNWAFRLDDFACIISKKLGMNEKALRCA